MSYYSWKPYVPVAERIKKAEKVAAKAKKAGNSFDPITAYRGAIAKTFWGKAWCDNMERYGDYENRLPRGRSYVRNGSVIDLKITKNEVRAKVVGSRLYEVSVSVKSVPSLQWKAISADCFGSIDSLVELLRGKLSQGVMERISKQGAGLFPSPKEINFDCSCPDWAAMCKHVAAVFYGIGARLDNQPELLFTLRGVDAKDLIATAGAGLKNTGNKPSVGKVLSDASLADVFGIEMADVNAPSGDKVKKRKPKVTDATTTTKLLAAVKKPAATIPIAKVNLAAKSGRRKITAEDKEREIKYRTEIPASKSKRKSQKKS